MCGSKNLRSPKTKGQLVPRQMSCQDLVPPGSTVLPQCRTGADTHS